MSGVADGERAEALRVLVADDDADILELLTRRLERRGYEVIPAADGDEALALALAHLPDAVVLDGLMPGLEGEQVCAELRDREPTATIPVVLLTAKATDADRQRAVDAGASAYMVKPFSIEELDETLRGLIGRGGWAA